MTVQIDTGQALLLALTTFGGPSLLMAVQGWRRRRRDREVEIARDATAAAEARERSDQHKENTGRLDEMTRVLESAFGSNGKRGFLVHRGEFDELRGVANADHNRVNEHAQLLGVHTEKLGNLRRDVDELRRAD